MSWVDKSYDKIKAWWGENLDTLPLYIWHLNVGNLHLEELFESWANTKLFWTMWETTVTNAVETRKTPMLIVTAGDREFCVVLNQGFAETMSRHFGDTIETCMLIKKKDKDLINVFLLDDMLKIDRKEFIGL